MKDFFIVINMKNKAAFTLIEILVVVGVLTVLVVSVGGIMGTTFKAKNTSEGNESLSSKAVYILAELKRNILYANPRDFTCSSGVGATGISFTTKDNATMSLICDDEDDLIYMTSTESGVYDYLENDFLAWCNNFVKCTKDDTDKVTKVEFKLNIGISANVAGAGSTGVYYGVAVPRE
ncbi:MAG: prepilin-type N-terminal cleavage/methylation domain-containing protein [Candidatus Shapirobacteria bacterium]|nr:prepilin-type N-terminal cleavage/methylation domain-containing protein [Candidatus Shapirobacteria bacterium]